MSDWDDEIEEDPAHEAALDETPRQQRSAPRQPNRYGWRGFAPFLPSIDRLRRETSARSRPSARQARAPRRGSKPGPRAQVPRSRTIRFRLFSGPVTVREADSRSPRRRLTRPAATSSTRITLPDPVFARSDHGFRPGKLRSEPRGARQEAFSLRWAQIRQGRREPVSHPHRPRRAQARRGSPGERSRSAAAPAEPLRLRSSEIQVHQRDGIAVRRPAGSPTALAAASGGQSSPHGLPVRPERPTALLGPFPSLESDCLASCHRQSSSSVCTTRKSSPANSASVAPQS